MITKVVTCLSPLEPGSAVHAACMLGRACAVLLLGFGFKAATGTSCAHSNVIKEC